MALGLVSTRTFLRHTTFIGLSGAGMLGRTGRCKPGSQRVGAEPRGSASLPLSPSLLRSFDNSANGYARGEAITSMVWKAGGPHKGDGHGVGQRALQVPDEAKDVEERLGLFVTGPA